MASTRLLLRGTVIYIVDPLGKYGTQLVSYAVRRINVFGAARFAAKFHLDEWVDVESVTFAYLSSCK